MKRSKKIIIAILSITILITGGFVIWANNSYEPTVEAMAALETMDNLKVIQDEYIIFEPQNVKPEKGLIFYPGAKVDPESYAELCSKIAEEGYLVVIAPMTLNLAILSPNEADGIIERFDNIEEWAIGGHSLGGVMACKYASENSIIKGVVLYASYPQGDELKDLNIEVISIYGSLDGVAKLDKVKEAILPVNSKIIEIEGGNHGQFGSYGKQAGDSDATISGREQIEQAAKYTIELLENM